MQQHKHFVKAAVQPAIVYKCTECERKQKAGLQETQPSTVAVSALTANTSKYSNILIDNQKIHRVFSSILSAVQARF
jgi:hypothetical protein